MDQMKIGFFLKELRKEKGLTQEELAERFAVSRRTVSRWETASNMPDLSILIELADYFNVELREILNGERKSEKMNEEVRETVLGVADYNNAARKKLNQRLQMLFIGGAIASIAYLIMLMTDHADNFFGGLCLGITFGMMIVGIIFTSKDANRIYEYKMRLLNKEKK